MGYNCPLIITTIVIVYSPVFWGYTITPLMDQTDKNSSGVDILTKAMFGDLDPQVVQIKNRQQLERVLTSLELIHCHTFSWLN